jgi:hypothetical protein
LSRLIAALCLLFFVTPAFAGGDARLFEVRDVTVDATAGGVQEARDQAFAQGQAAAFDMLLRRLTLKSDWSKLPPAAGQDVKRLIAGFAVSSEKRSTTRYIGKLNYTFVPDRIRAILRGAGVPFTETRSKPVLVLPVLEAGDGRALLWEPENAWAAAWREKAGAQALVPVIVPAGDPSDQTASQGLSPRSPSWDAIAALANAKGASAAIVPILTLRRAGTQVTASIRLIQLRPGHSDEQVASAQASDEASAMPAAVDAVMDVLNEAWKQGTVIADAGLQSLIADVSYSGLDGWMRVRRSLRDVSSVRGMKIIALAADGAQLQIDYVGSPEQLGVSLAQSDLVLSPGIGGHYSLESRGGSPAPAAAPPAPPAPDPGASAPTSGSPGTLPPR